ncbi:MAG: PCRF domain-containing protein, partial [Methylococcales bacterium]|nr:PCRF domain-containing protein [Methylococcales bacterium]
MQEINPIKNTILDLRNRGSALKDYLDFTTKSERLVEVLRELEDPQVWNDPAQAQALGKERGILESIVNTITELEQGLTDAEELLEMAVEDNDEETVETVVEDLQVFEKKVAELEFRRMFSGEMDANNAFLDIQS